MTGGGAADTVISTFHQLARQFPDRPAVLWGTTPISYASLVETSTRLSRALLEDGVHAGDRVALILDNSPDFVISYLAILGAGAVAVPLNPRAPVAAHARVFEDCRPVAAFFQSSDPEAALSIGSSAPDFKIAYSANWPGTTRTATVTTWRTGERIASVGAAGDLDLPAAESLALIVYTSGTTGNPKGVMLSHANMRHISDAGRELCQLGPADRIGAVVPLFHLYGLRDIDLALSTGAAIVIPRHMNFPARMLSELRDANVTGISSVPSSLAILIERYHRELSECLSDLRYLAIGTAPMPSRGLAALRDALPRTRLITTYGLTEASRVCWHDVTDPMTPADPRIVGRPYSAVRLSLVDEVAGIGRVAVGSGMVMLGYWANEAATRAIITADAMVLTPDCGRFAPDGTLHLLGRIDDVINCGGEKVSPVEIEEVIARHPMVAAVTVLRIPDPDGVLGEVAQAIVVRKEGVSLSSQEVLQHAATMLEPYKVPRSVEFVREIPLSVLGKPRRAAMKGS